MNVRRGREFQGVLGGVWDAVNDVCFNHPTLVPSDNLSSAEGKPFALVVTGWEIESRKWSARILYGTEQE